MRNKNFLGELITHREQLKYEQYKKEFNVSLKREFEEIESSYLEEKRKYEEERREYKYRMLNDPRFALDFIIWIY